MNQVLLTVSGDIDSDIEMQIAEGQRPMADYIAMARAFKADLLDYTAARTKSGRFGRLLERVGGSNLLLAWVSFRERKRYGTIFTDGEQIGLPLALMLKFLNWGKKPRHLMIVHILSTRSKTLLVDLFRLHSHIDTFFVYSTWQQQFIEDRWGVPPERVVFTPFMVDADFFSPAAVESLSTIDLDSSLNDHPLICSVGLERRDYPTLIEAVRDMDLQLVIAAASPWSKQADSTQGQEMPPNVTVRRFTQYELRQVYARSRFLVMPLLDVTFQAGVTAILEAMSMEKAVIVTRTKGQTDVIKDGENGIYVEPGDANALRYSIQRLLDQPANAANMGANGRQVILNEMSLECYTRRLGGFVKSNVN